MIIIPAIDVKDGKCVRLKQGRMDAETIFSDNPEEMAEQWIGQGAQRLHLVDLDGANQGKPVNQRVIQAVVNRVSVPVELGGGIRDMDTLSAYLDLGIRWVILGTVAHRNPEFALAAVERFPDQVIVGIDAKSGLVAVEGWTEETTVRPVDLARRFEGTGISAIIYTDILRDGMRSGPNIDETRALAEATDIPVIASGGISDLNDVSSVLSLSAYGVVGLISGRALYDGSLALREALALVASATR